MTQGHFRPFISRALKSLLRPWLRPTGWPTQRPRAWCSAVQKPQLHSRACGWAWTPLSGRARTPRLRARARPLFSGTGETGCSPSQACDVSHVFTAVTAAPFFQSKTICRVRLRCIAISEMGERRHTNKVHVAQTGLPLKLRTSVGKEPARPGPGEVLTARDEPGRTQRHTEQASAGPPRWGHRQVGVPLSSVRSCVLGWVGVGVWLALGSGSIMFWAQVWPCWFFAGQSLGVLMNCASAFTPQCPPPNLVGWDLTAPQVAGCTVCDPGCKKAWSHAGHR